MPAFAYWPGTIPAGSRSTEIVSSLDIVPTAISLAGGSLPTDLIIDGRDASPLILTETGKSAHNFLPFYNEPVYSNASKEIFAARFGRYKAVRIPLDHPYCCFHCQGSCHNCHHPFGLKSPHVVCCSRCPPSLRLSLSLAPATLVATFSISSPRPALATAGGPGTALLPKHTMIHPSFLTSTPILAKRYPFPPTIYQRGSSRGSCWQNANTRPRSLPSTLTRTLDFSSPCAVASGAPPIMGRALASAKTFRCPSRCRERDGEPPGPV